MKMLPIMEMAKKKKKTTSKKKKMLLESEDEILNSEVSTAYEEVYGTGKNLRNKILTSMIP